MMKKTVLKVVLSAVPALLAAAPAASATLVLDAGGKLTGARDVIVDGTAYNVAFVAGTCATAFGRCTSQAFAFRTVETAQRAARALLDQVFVDTWIDGRFRRFDQDTTQTAGCDHGSICHALIPFASLFNGAVFEAVGALNRPTEATDAVTGALQYSAGLAPTAFNQNIYARFEVAAAAVPEPATWAMMLAGFGGVGFATRRRRRRGAIVAA